MGGTSKKHTLEYIRNKFAGDGCELLEELYENAHVKMKYKCKKGNIHHTSWNTFQSGHRCLCARGHQKVTYDFLINEFNSQGCELLEKEYLGYSIPMSYKCKCGNISKITWDNFRKGVRCKKCGYDKYRGPKNHNWNPNRNIVKLNESIRKKYYCALRRTLKYLGKKKLTSSEKLLGYTTQQLKEHLENHPDWEAVRNTKWSLDHIYPISAFIEHDIFDPKIINSLENLRPVTASENSSKRDKYDEIKFLKWLEQKTKSI